MADTPLSAVLQNVERELETPPAEVARFAPAKLRGGTLQSLHAEGRQISERHQREWTEWQTKIKNWNEEYIRNLG
jgi:hypothetical protein